MFSISTKAIYGLKAMTEMAYLSTDNTIQIQEIAANRSIPQAYLEQILMLLRRAGLVKSFRGSQGGYALAKNPADITLKDILEPLEGPVSVLGEQDPAENLGFVWRPFEKTMDQMLARTLESIVSEEKESKDALIYMI